MLGGLPIILLQMMGQKRKAQNGSFWQGENVVMFASERPKFEYAHEQ
jgi:hypothetical protein